MSNKTIKEPYEVFAANTALIWFRFRCLVAFGMAITTTISAYGLGAGYETEQVVAGGFGAFAVYFALCGFVALCFEAVEGRVAREISEDRRNVRSTS